MIVNYLSHSGLNLKQTCSQNLLINGNATAAREIMSNERRCDTGLYILVLIEMPLIGT